MFFTASDLTFTPQTYPQLATVSTLAQPLHSFWGYFFCSSLVAYWARIHLGSSSFTVISFCSSILFMGFSRQECWSGCHSLLQWTTFCQNSPQWPVRLGGPTRHGLVSLSYTRLWSIWLDWLVVCDCGFSLSALWCPLSVPTVLLGFLLPWTWGISSWLLQQSAADAPHLGYGLSPHRRGSWLWTWYLLSTAAPDLGCGVSPLFPLATPVWCSHHSPIRLWF